MLKGKLLIHKRQPLFCFLDEENKRVSSRSDDIQEILENNDYWVDGSWHSESKINMDEWEIFSGILLKQIYTSREAAELWKLSPNTVTQWCNRGRFEEGEARKSGKVWIVTKNGMERLTGRKAGN